MALQTTITFSLAALLSKSLDLVVPTALPVTLARTIQMATGVATGLADMVWGDIGTVGPSATISLDLAGPMLDAFKDPFLPVKLKAIAFSSDPANLNNTHLVRPAAGVPWLLAAADAVIIPPGGGLLWYAPQGGVVVTPTTADIIEITNAAGTNTNAYAIALVGASA